MTNNMVVTVGYSEQSGFWFGSVLQFSWWGDKLVEVFIALSLFHDELMTPLRLLLHYSNYYSPACLVWKAGCHLSFCSYVQIKLRCWSLAHLTIVTSYFSQAVCLCLFFSLSLLLCLSFLQILIVGGVCVTQVLLSGCKRKLCKSKTEFNVN